MTTIIILIILGLFLLIVELFFLVGSMKIGILGTILLLIAVLMGFANHGQDVGFLVLGITAAIGFLLFILTFWFFENKEIGLQETLEGRVNEIDHSFFIKGLKGISFGDLKLSGQAIFNDKMVDVESQGEYIEDKTAIEISRIDGGKIYVRKQQS